MTKREVREFQVPLKKIADYINFIYGQPRESNQDNEAFLIIGNQVGAILKDMRENYNV